jgi:hypothetical protein
MQMAAALAELGYLADRFAPLENRALFKAKIVACLQSKLPVILLMTRKLPTGAGEILSGHAVTVTGFSEPTQIVDVPSSRAGWPPSKMKGAGVSTLYVHDDNLGSHAHYELIDSTMMTDEGHPALLLRRGGRQGSGKPTPWWTSDEWTIFGALVPKPDKLRLSVGQLFHQFIALQRLIKIIFPTADMHYSHKFAPAVDYKRELFGRGLEPATMRTVAEASLPRFIGVVSVHIGSDVALEIVLDVSEVERTSDKPPILAMVAPGVPARSTAWANIQEVCRHLGCPFSTAPFRLLSV